MSTKTEVENPLAHEPIPLKTDDRKTFTIAGFPIFELIWRLTESDFWTFVVPDTVFGILGALAGPVLTTSPSASFLDVIARGLHVLAFAWLNLIIFDLANQRESSMEDRINKPNRPIPAGLLTPKQMRRMLLAAIPLVLAVSYFLQVWRETALLIALTWMYNDLEGGDECITRNVIIAAAFALYNAGALRVAIGSEAAVSSEGYCWTALISAVILSSMHIQDLKDQAGDLVRGRLTAPLLLGDGVARWTIAVPIILWSGICPAYIGVGLGGYVVPAGLGLIVAIRTLWQRDRKADKKSWKIWAMWLISLYTLPLVKNHESLNIW